MSISNTDVFGKIKDVSRICLHDYCEGNIRHRIHTALEACRQLQLLFKTLPCKVEGLSSKQQTISSIVNHLTNLNSDIATQVNWNTERDNVDTDSTDEGISVSGKLEGYSVSATDKSITISGKPVKHCDTDRESFEITWNDGTKHVITRKLTD